MQNFHHLAIQKYEAACNFKELQHTYTKTVQNFSSTKFFDSFSALSIFSESRFKMIPLAIQERLRTSFNRYPLLLDILGSLHEHAGKVLLVGGAVRDLFLDRSIHDLDFEVYGLTLEQLQNILQQYGYVSLVGKSFGVLRVHGLDIDWSLPRTDSSGRHPIVSYDPWMSYEQACIRRDLTINAMGIDLQSMQLVDPYDGLQDLESRLLRAPDLNFFVQDPLRLLRVMQFVGRFEMHVDQELSKVCQSIDLSSISSERIEQEFTKLFLWSQRPSLGLQWLMNIQQFSKILPGVILNQKTLLQLDAAGQQEYLTDQDKLVVMWAVIAAQLKYVIDFHEFQEISRQKMQPWIDLMQSISQQRCLSKQVARLIAYRYIFVAHATDAQLKWLADWLAPDVSLRLFFMYLRVVNVELDVDAMISRVILLHVYDYPELPVLTGQDLSDVAQGKQLGQLLKKAYQIQIDQAITDRSVLKRKVLML